MASALHRPRRMPEPQSSSRSGAWAYRPAGPNPARALKQHASSPPPRPAEETTRYDIQAIQSGLKSRIDGEVRFDDGTRALYATDGSNYRQTPLGVVIPRHSRDILETLQICRRYGAPILARGGGTSLAGQCCNVAVILDMSKYMNQVIEIDPKRRLAQVIHLGLKQGELATHSPHPEKKYLREMRKPFFSRGGQSPLRL